jgi:hypothetical protein
VRGGRGIKVEVEIVWKWEEVMRSREIFMK